MYSAKVIEETMKKETELKALIRKEARSIIQKAVNERKIGILKEDFPNMLKWWKEDPKKVMEFVYWLQKKTPPTGDKWNKAWKNIAIQLNKKHKAPSSELKKIMGESVNEAKSTDWEVTYDANNIAGKKIKKGTKVKVKARNSEEAHKKAAKSLGLADYYHALKGKTKKLGESKITEASKVDTALKNKAKKSGMPLGVLRQVYKRGLAAWKVGHKPGATQHAWAMGRVNSFATKSPGTWGKADKDLAKKVRGSKK
jgi:hypothetical protein